MLCSRFTRRFSTVQEVLPPECRVSRMVFLPKGSDSRDRSDFVSRAPAFARPLSRANADAKIFSDAF
eukprot:279813-Pyramimonas_sp.AAC.1